MRRAALLLLAACATLRLAAVPAAAEDRRSGFDEMGPALQEMQRDDMANPAMLWALEGATLWETPAGTEATACAGCHGDAEQAMAGVAARHPAWDETTGRPVDLAGRIENCRTGRQGAAPFGRESRELLALTTWLGLQSRGAPVAPDPDPRLDAWRDRGAALWSTRTGQLNLACAHCHDDLAGGRLAATLIPQAHPVGYPIYRLEWQDMGSLERRLRNCMSGVRAEPYAFGSDEHLALELHLMDRAEGMTFETPAVRP